MKFFLLLIFIFLLISPCVYADDFICIRVIDGDTLVINNGEKIRLIGIDTPESIMNSKLRKDSKRTGQDIETITKMGKQATKATKDLVLGKKVKLEYDVQEKDKYGRTLAYVYLPDGKMLNAELVRLGYAQIMTVPPDVKYADLFLKLQREARENKRGFWAEE